MNIFEKMLKVTEKINKVAKNLKVGVGQGTYKAVGEADVLEAVKPVEIEYGVYSYPFSRKVIETNVFTTTSEYTDRNTHETRTTEKNTLFLRLETIYRFVNVEKPDEFVDITTYGDGVDPQDKAPGKAMTYSDKYALLKAYKIETGDDPDKDPSGELIKPTDKKKPAPKSQTSADDLDEDPIQEQINELKTYGKTLDDIATQVGKPSGIFVTKCEVEEKLILLRNWRKGQEKKAAEKAAKEAAEKAAAGAQK